MKKYILGVYAALLAGNAISADFTGSWGMFAIFRMVFTVSISILNNHQNI